MATKLRKSRPLLSFLSLFLGLHILFGCAAAAVVAVSAAGGLPAYVSLLTEQDFRETPMFRRLTESVLYTALQDAIASGEGRAVSSWGTPDSPNLLFYSSYDGKETGRSTTEPVTVTDGAVSFPDGYDFLLHFDGETVTITQDGEDVPLFEDGYYTSASLWELPGCRNREDTFFASFAEDELARCDVWLAVRTEPLAVPGDGVTRVFDLWGAIRAEFAVWLYLLVLGAGLLVLYGARRESRERLWAAAAQGTRRVWWEGKVLVLALSGAAFLFFLCVFLRYTWDATALPYLGVTADLFLWVLLFFSNDAHRTPKDERRSLMGTLRASAARRRARLPFQKKLLAYGPSVWMGILVFLFLVLVFALLFGGGSLLLDVPLAVPGAVLWLRARRRFVRAVEDAGALVDRIGAVSRGETLPPPALPPDSDLAEAERQLGSIDGVIRTSVERQMKSERMKIELIANVSHDLKTPLTSILSYAGLLQEEELPEAAKGYAAVLAEKAERLRRMVQDVFEVSKAATGNLPLTMERLDLAKLVRQTMADLSEQLDASGLQFRVSLSSEPVYIVADGQRLYRVFQNLLENIVKYSLENTRVYIRQTVSSGRVLTVLQNVSRDELGDVSALTERFVRGDASRTDGGSGLGLSIAKSFTEACGGRFAVRTEGDLFSAEVEFGVVTEEEAQK